MSQLFLLNMQVWCGAFKTGLLHLVLWRTQGSVGHGRCIVASTWLFVILVLVLSLSLFSVLVLVSSLVLFLFSVWVVWQQRGSVGHYRCGKASTQRNLTTTGFFWGGDESWSSLQRLRKTHSTLAALDLKFWEAATIKAQSKTDGNTAVTAGAEK